MVVTPPNLIQGSLKVVRFLQIVIHRHRHPLGRQRPKTHRLQSKLNKKTSLLKSFYLLYVQFVLRLCTICFADYKWISFFLQVTSRVSVTCRKKIGTDSPPPSCQNLTNFDMTGHAQKKIKLRKRDPVLNAPRHLPLVESHAGFRL